MTWAVHSSPYQSLGAGIVSASLAGRRSSPNHDIHSRRSEGTAACAKGFLKADLQVCSVAPGDAAPGIKVSEAQEADLQSM